MGTNAALVQILGYADYAVMAILGLMSVWAVSIVIDRLLMLKSVERDLVAERSLETLGVMSALQELGGDNAENFSANYPVAAEPFVRKVSRGLPVLGTMGNASPFIGLFGTVLGIIKAFQDLALADKAGPQVVMAGISAALLATALGLLVAIPAVIAYNYFSLRVARIRRDLEHACWREVRSAKAQG